MRSYGQFCGIAHALDLVGERWAMLVVREVVLGPKRFTDLQAGLPGIGTNVLTTRLKELEQNDILQRRVLPPPAASTVYELTEYGRQLEPALLALGRWGARSMGRRAPEQTLQAGWLGVAFRAFGRPGATVGMNAVCEFDLDDGAFHARLEDGALEIGGGPASDPDVVVRAGSETLAALLGGALEPDDALDSGAIGGTGDRHLMSRILNVFRPALEPS
jgi:DNA-binding HxlR family transcriptional regulator